MFNPKDAFLPIFMVAEVGGGISSGLVGDDEQEVATTEVLEKTKAVGWKYSSPCCFL